MWSYIQPSLIMNLHDKDFLVHKSLMWQSHFNKLGLLLMKHSFCLFSAFPSGIDKRHWRLDQFMHSSRLLFHTLPDCCCFERTKVAIHVWLPMDKLKLDDKWATWGAMWHWFWLSHPQMEQTPLKPQMKRWWTNKSLASTEFRAQEKHCYCGAMYVLWVNTLKIYLYWSCIWTGNMA